MKKLPPDGRQSVAQGQAHRLGQGHHQAEVTQALPHAVPRDELAGVGGGKHGVDGEEHAGARPQEHQKRDGGSKGVAQQKQGIEQLGAHQQPFAVHPVGQNPRHRGHKHPDQRHDSRNGGRYCQCSAQIQCETGHQWKGHLTCRNICQAD